MVSFKRSLTLLIVFFVVAIIVFGTTLFFQNTPESRETNDNISTSEEDSEQSITDPESENEMLAIDELLPRALESIDYDLFREAITIASAADSVSAAGDRDLNIDELRIDPERFERLLSSTLAERIDFLDLKIRFRYSDAFRRVEVRVETFDETNEETITATKLFRITSA